MLSLAFILIVTGICVFISCSISSDPVTWFEYYKGGVVGLFISGVVLQMWNKRKRDEEMKRKR
jgi:hypothetical protein